MHRKPPSIDPTLAPQRVGNVQNKLAKTASVCFAHDGFAVAGAAGEKSVYVWDVERGEQLLSLDHGGEFPNYKENNSDIYHRGFKGTHSSGAWQ